MCLVTDLSCPDLLWHDLAPRLRRIWINGSLVGTGFNYPDLTGHDFFYSRAGVKLAWSDLDLTWPDFTWHALTPNRPDTSWPLGFPKLLSCPDLWSAMDYSRFTWPDLTDDPRLPTDMEPLTAVSVEPPPPLPQLHLVAEGRPFQLSCLAPEGRPPAAVWWETPAGVVLNKPRKVQVARDVAGMGLSLPLGAAIGEKDLFVLSLGPWVIISKTVHLGNTCGNMWELNNCRSKPIGFKLGYYTNCQPWQLCQGGNTTCRVMHWLDGLIQAWVDPADRFGEGEVCQRGLTYPHFQLSLRI